MPKELITLQLGHYANFVGTHFWNLQEASFSYNPQQPTSKEIDLNVLHREGETLSSEPTFTPRVIICDYKGSLKSLSRNGGLYEESERQSHPVWDGKISEELAEKPRTNRFLDEVAAERKSIPVVNGNQPKRPKYSDYDLENCVETWTDFLGVSFHPKSIHLLDSYWLNDESNQFGSFGLGREELKRVELKESLENSIRFFVEECDNLQGFQMFADAHDGFSGLASGMMQYIHEEFGSKAVIVYPLYAARKTQDQNSKDLNGLFNFAMTLAGSSEDDAHTAYIPISTVSKLTRPQEFLGSLPLAKFQQIPYHTSAVLAGAVDTLSLLPRLASEECVHLRDIVEALTVHQRKVAAMSTMLPFPLQKTTTLFSALKAIDADYLPVTSLTPHVTTPLIDSQNRCYSQVMSLRGIPKERWQCTSDEIQSHRLSYEVASMSASRLFENFMSSYCPNTFGIGRVTEFPSHTRVPYPQFFSESITEYGYLDSSQSRTEDVKRVPVMAGVHSTDKLKDLLKDLTDFCKEQKLDKLPGVLSATMELDECKESFERLETLSERYREESY